MAEGLDAFSKCTFSLKVDDTASTIPASSCSFTLFDSIYNLYPKATFNLNDYTGRINEYMGVINGTKITISFGATEDTIVRCPYRVINNSVPQQKSQNGTGGDIELSLIHDYYNTQVKTSRAFNSNISDIIGDKVKEYSFDGVNIDQTLNSGLWYQPYITDAEFIMYNLLPFAYSTDSEKTPFYCFIDSNNYFNLKNYKSMMLENPVKEFTYKSLGNIESLSNDSILSISFAQIPVSKMKPFYNRMLTYFSENGTYVKEDTNAKITDYPSSEINPIPIKANLNNLTGIMELLDDDVNFDDTKNNRLGQEINSVSECISPDKVIITVNLDRSLCAGKKVKINLPATSSNATSELSLRNSGEYLIESSYHKWDGRRAITTLVCSKQTVKVIADYKNVAMIANRG